MTTAVAPAIAAPASTACEWCAREVARCFACGKTGRAAVSFGLAPTHTYRVRQVDFQQVAPELAGLPAGYFCGRMLATCARSVKGKGTVRRYYVREMPCDFEGRAFEFRKPGERGRYHVYMPACGGVTCSCAGNSYEATSKANYKAHLAEAEQVVSAGCVHADSLLALREWMEGEVK